MSLNIFIGLVINQQTDLPGKKSADQQRRRQLPGKKKFLEKQQRRQIDQIKDQIFHDPEHLLFPISCRQVPHLSPDKLNRHNVESHSRIGKYIKFVRYKEESQQHTGQIKGRSHPQSGFPYHDPCKVGRCGKKEQGVGLYDSSEHHEQHRQRQQKAAECYDFCFYMHEQRSPPIHSHNVSAHHRSQQIFPVPQVDPPIPYPPP